jgi:hypothetical protein
LIDYHWSWPIMKHFVAKPADVPTGDSVETDDADADPEAAMFIRRGVKREWLFARRLSDPNEDHAVPRAHYESVRDACIAELDLLDDEFYRGFAAHQIIEICVAAGT